MKLWTIQTRAVLASLRERGSLSVDLRGRSVPYSYTWLAARLSRVIDGYGGGLPWWLHTQPKPWWTRDAGPDRDEVVLELTIPRERVFTLPSWAWQRVFLGQYLALGRVEHLRWRRGLARASLREGDLDSWLEPDPAGLPGPLEALREASFDRIFGAALPDRAWRGARRFGYDGPKGREAVTETLETAWLTRVHEPSTRFDAQRGLGTC